MTFPDGATLKQTSPETWVLATPGPSKEEIGRKVVWTYRAVLSDAIGTIASASAAAYPKPGNA